MLKLLSIGAAALWLAGCAPVEKMTAPAEPTAPVALTAPSNAAPEKSTASQAVEGFTGKTAVDAGQRTKSRVQIINEQQRKKLEEMPQ